MDPLATTYLGLPLRSPLVASASPLTGRPEQALRLEEAGAAAVVLPSLFEEEIIHEDVDLLMALEQGSEHFAEALDYFPDFIRTSFESAAERYLRVVREMHERLSVPVIASLNATSSSGWVRYAQLIEEAGADALELNPTVWRPTPAQRSQGGTGPRGGARCALVSRHSAGRQTGAVLHGPGALLPSRWKRRG